MIMNSSWDWTLSGRARVSSPFWTCFGARGVPLGAVGEVLVGEGKVLVDPEDWEVREGYVGNGSEFKCRRIR